MAQKSTKERFVEVFPTLLQDVLDLLPPTLPAEAKQWIKECMEYNIPGGKMNRGLSVIDTLKALLRRELTEDEFFKAAVLGWSVEWLQAFFLVADDIMDQSPVRRGQPCWYKLEKVGLVAINDSFILESCIYKLFKKYFRQEKYYIDLVELLHETSWQTELGQVVDLITAPEDDINLDRFSLERHSWIVTYKTAYYSFYLPVAMGMLVAGITDPAVFKQAEDILIPLGEHFQIHDDYIDCYEPPEVIGKIGTDIEDNKCSWLINQALKLCTPEQRKLLDENYGRKNPSNVAVVKGIYNELDLKGVYKRHEDAAYNKLTELVSQVDDQVIPREVFTSFIYKIFKR
ncbi:farnesyl pyrophosphate synthase [Basidiobolus meristosporus CBS 931.73]|uniref:Farnesyl pyrophosphate synthase n=1 Tax=Basidiobolus meristosporus CBS 931.73 TaxID=1314790 RepID=A0A1Y1Z0J6_9FUNG|nr:farnesyl pyrophosphate synthase [Basidiobolus meristosporus CBS 931.73]|eukprot:ORY03706.1 farnesyl pyrophosphate synthase [Basidiobolus meristosporus CBS 931.73]